MQLNKYLLNKVKKDYDVDTSCRLFAEAKEARTNWDSQALIGLLIYTNDFLRNRKLKADTSGQRDFYNINFVKDNLLHTIAQILVQEIDVLLENNRKEPLPAQDILEMEVNTQIDQQRVIRQLHQVVVSQKFMGFGAGKVYWDVEDNSDNEWINGKPKHLPLDSRKCYYITEHNTEDKRDIIHFFHVESFTKNKFEAKYPEFYKKWEEKIESYPEDDKHIQAYKELGIIHVVTHQFKHSCKVKERAIADEDPNAMRVEHFSEQEVKEYLQDQGANESNIEEFDKVLEIEDETPLLPEQVRASKPLTRTETGWYQSVFIPEINEAVTDVESVGKRCEYVLMHGRWNPDSDYPISEAYDKQELLKLSGILLTTMALNTVKLQKPIPLVVSGALKNEANFLKNYHRIGVIAKVDPEWAKNNPNTKPVTWLQPPPAGQMQAMLFQMIDSLLEKSMGTPPASKGYSEFSGESGEHARVMKMANAVGNKPDFFGVEEYLRKVAERYKDLIAEKRTYPHKMYLEKKDHIEGLTEIQGTKAVAEVNTNPENDLRDVAKRCFARVEIEENEEQQRLFKDQQYEKLYRAKDIDFTTFIETQSWVKSPNKLIEAHKKAQPELAMAQIINENPQMKEQLMQMMESGQLQETSAPEKEPMPKTEVQREATHKAKYGEGSPLPKRQYKNRKNE